MADELDVLLAALLAPLGHSGPFPRELYRHVSRMASATAQTELSWLASVDKRPDDWARLIAAATVGHTSFYRHGEHFRMLALRAPELARTKGALRVWSLGCSTGEEVWSIAVCLDALGLEFSLLATDVNPKALEKASVGRYEARQTSGLVGYEGRGFRASDKLRARVRFRRHALGEPLCGANAPFDIIFCRNVLIYLSPERTRAAWAFLVEHLSLDGCLAVAPVEALGELPEGLSRGAVVGWLERRPPKDKTVRPPRALSTKARLVLPSAPCRVERALEVAATHLSAGDLELAARELHEILATRNDALGWFLLGETCARRGEVTQAKIAFSRVSQADLVPADVDLETLKRAAARRAKMLE